MSRTIVVFRKYKEGDIIALFSNHTNSKTLKVSSYMHMGQHSDADYQGVIAATKLATPSEYMELKKELESIGYNLTVRKRAKVRFS